MATPQPKRVLVIGDLHAPFDLTDYLDHCKAVAKKYKTDHVVCIGDGIDNHYSSFHETDPDGYSAADELDRAIDHLSLYHKAFPHADYILGNHCRIIERKLVSAGLSRRWMRTFPEVIGIPTWKVHTRLIIDGVLYIHGEGVTARTRLMREGRSVVQGHRHTEGYVWYHRVGLNHRFGMQVGTGIDEDTYAFAYAKDQPAPILSCGVVIAGTQAYIEPMF